jgi:hypothetical protein
VARQPARYFSSASRAFFHWIVLPSIKAGRKWRSGVGQDVRQYRRRFVLWFEVLVIPHLFAAVCWLISVTFSVRCSGSSSPRSLFMLSVSIFPIDLALSAASDS